MTCTDLVPVSKVRTHRKAKKPAASAKAVQAGLKGEAALPTLRVVDLRVLAKAKGLRPTTKHTKGELLAMLASGQPVRPAALDRQNLARREARAAK